MKRMNLAPLKLNTLRAKITLLSAASVLFLAGIGAFFIVQITSVSNTSGTALREVNTAMHLLKTTTDMRRSFQSQVQEWKDVLLRGNDPALYDKYFKAFEKKHEAVESDLLSLRQLAAEVNQPDVLTTQQVDELSKLHAELHQRYLNALKGYNATHPTAGQEVDLGVRGMDRPFTAALNKTADGIAIYAQSVTDQNARNVGAHSSATFWVTLVALLLSIPLMVALGYYIARGFIRHLDAFMDTISKVQEGDFAARADASGEDELAQLAKSFNNLLDNRVVMLANIQRENDRLNESVLDLLRAVAQLSQKDLTIKVPVSEDVTGAVSDALNVLSSETAKVLKSVSDISAEVTSASLLVQRQSDNMLLAASEEREDMQRAVHSLAEAAEAMQQIASLGQQCNVVADNALQTTHGALSAVNNTVLGINSTRDVIRETEKRIKRLGERSQEISGAVNLINTIAERTHILALNASMHAASAGEAGRGFGVVADEVQRLAENSRQATQQIAALVHNIQVETSDTVNTMNDVITQIVEGSRLAEQAGQQMQQTQQTTEELVSSVRQIAESSEAQIRVGQELVDLASTLKTNSESNSEKLLEQSSNTNNLVEFAKRLLESVRVFKLPA